MDNIKSTSFEKPIIYKQVRDQLFWIYNPEIGNDVLFIDHELIAGSLRFLCRFLRVILLNLLHYM
jgi:hypothetical protein